jgi:uncharacterized protein YciI
MVTAMYVIELAFTDDQRRLAARPAHRERLARLHKEGVLVLAGPWGDDSGAMLIFRADLDAVNEIIAADPYYSTPGVAVTRMLEWQSLEFSR